MEDVGMKTMSALESQGENIERWEEVVDGINQVKRLHDNIFFKECEKAGNFESVKCLLREPVNHLYTNQLFSELQTDQTRLLVCSKGKTFLSLRLGDSRL
jgi:hypothetical protein